MRRVMKILIVLLLLFTTINAASTKVYLSVTPSEIFNGEEVKVLLNIETSKRVKIDFPEIDKIANYPVISIKDRKKSIIKEVNGTQIAVAKITRIYTIMPTKTIFIGPFELKVDNKVYRTKTKKIKVVNSSSKGNNFVFRMSSNKKEVVVGEPFVVKIELVEPTALSSSNIEYLAPRFENFIVVPLGSGTTEQKGSNLIRTIRYLLRAKSAGNFTLEPATAKIEIQAVPVSQSPFAFFGDEALVKTIATNTVPIKVKQLPQKVDIIGDYKIKATVNKQKSRAKKPIEYTLTISGKGSLDSLKDITISIPNVTIYPKDPKIEHIATENGVESRYIRKFVLIANSDFTIPSIELKEYNTATKRVKLLKTKPIKIDIKSLSTITSLLQGSGVKNNKSKDSITSQNIALNKKVIQNDEPDKKIEEILFDKEYYKRKYSKENYSLSMLFLGLLLGVVIGIIATMYIPKLLEQKRAKKSKERLYENFEDALNILYPHTTEDPKIEEMVKGLYEVVNGNHAITIDQKLLNKMIKKIKKREKKRLRTLRKKA